MAIKNKRLLLLAAVAMTALPLSQALATTTNMDATAKFRVAITLTPSNMEFGNIDYAGLPTVAGDFVELGTDGNTAYGGVFTAGTGSTINAGSVVVATGDVGATVEVRCDATATMEEAGGGSIGIVAIEVTDAAATAAFGAGNPCLGVGGAAATTLVLDGTDEFKFGGKIDGSTAAGFVSGDYSTATGAGDDIQVDVIYQ